MHRAFASILVLLAACGDVAPKDEPRSSARVDASLHGAREALEEYGFTRDPAGIERAIGLAEEAARVAELAGEGRVAASALLARALLLADRFDAARDAAEAAIRAHAVDDSSPELTSAPGAGLLFAVLGESSLALGDLGTASAALRTALDLSAPDARLLHLFGQCHEQQGDDSAAHDAYARAVALEPTRAATHLRLASVLERSGDPASSEAALAEFYRWSAIEAEREYALKEVAAAPGDAERLAAVARAELDLGRFDEARAWAQRAIRLDAGLFEAELVAGLAASASDDVDAARAHFVRAAEIDDGDGRPRLELASSPRAAATATACAWPSKRRASAVSPPSTAGSCCWNSATTSALCCASRSTSPPRPSTSRRASPRPRSLSIRTATWRPRRATKRSSRSTPSTKGRADRSGTCSDSSTRGQPMTRTARAGRRWPRCPVASCGSGDSEAEPQRGGGGDASSARGATGEVRFRDATAGSGLGAFEQQSGRPDKPTVVESFGAGVALFDYDGDGDLDAFLTNAGDVVDPNERQSSRDALFQNDGRGRFTDVTEEAGIDGRGWSTGVEAADVDGDGVVDLFVTAWGRNTLWRGRGDGTFEDVTEAAGLADDAWSTGAAFLDVDRDGDLDLYVANHIRLDRWKDGELVDEHGDPRREIWFGQEVYFGPRGLDGESDRFFLNRGDGTFEDATQAFGVDAYALYSFEAVALDADGDGWMDVYVANDSRPNLLWRNVRGERFEEQGVASGAALSANGGPQAGMGVAVGDPDADGDVDLFVTNFSEDYFTLYAGAADGRFDDVTPRAQMVAATRPFLGWSAGFEDLDADGYLDLWCVNGHVFPQADRVDRGMGYAQSNQVFLGDGHGRFALARDLGGGFDVRAASRGGAAGDVDGDGDVDVLVGNLDGPPTLLVNETSERVLDHVVLQLVGLPPNTTAHGARVVAERMDGDEAVAMTRYVGTGAGFLSCTGSTVHFGLGGADRLRLVQVYWPDGTRETLGAIDAGWWCRVEQGAGIIERRPLGRVEEER